MLRIYKAENESKMKVGNESKMKVGNEGNGYKFTTTFDGDACARALAQK